MDDMNLNLQAEVLEAEIVNGVLQMKHAIMKIASRAEVERDMRLCGQCELAAMKLGMAASDVMEALGRDQEVIYQRLYLGATEV